MASDFYALNNRSEATLRNLGISEADREYVSLHSLRQLFPEFVLDAFAAGIVEERQRVFWQEIVQLFVRTRNGEM